LRMAVAEVRADGVQPGVGQRLEEGAVVLRLAQPPPTRLPTVLVTPSSVPPPEPPDRVPVPPAPVTVWTGSGSGAILGPGVRAVGPWMPGDEPLAEGAGRPPPVGG